MTLGFVDPFLNMLLQSRQTAELNRVAGLQGGPYDMTRQMQENAADQRRQAMVSALGMTPPGPRGPEPQSPTPPMPPERPEAIGSAIPMPPPRPAEMPASVPAAPVPAPAAPPMVQTLGGRNFNDDTNAAWREGMPPAQAPALARPQVLSQALQAAPTMPVASAPLAPLPASGEVLRGSEGSDTLLGRAGVNVGMYRSDVPYDGRTAAVRYNNPAAAWPSERALAFGMTGYGVLNDGQNNKIARFPDQAHGAAYNMDLLARQYRGMSIGDAVRKWRGGNPGSSSIPAGYSAATRLDDGLLSDRGFMTDFFAKMAGHEGRGGAALPPEVLNKAFDIYSGARGAQPAASAADAIAAAPTPVDLAARRARDSVDVGGLAEPVQAAAGQVLGQFPGLSISSGYRSPEYNAKVGGAKGSRHMHRDALDVVGVTPENVGPVVTAAREAGFKGFGYYGNGSLHMDMGEARAWGPDRTRKSLGRTPEAFRDALAAPLSGGGVSDALAGSAGQDTLSGGSGMAAQPRDRREMLAELLRGAIPTAPTLSPLGGMGGGQAPAPTEEAPMQGIVAAQNPLIRAVSFVGGGQSTPEADERRRVLSESLMAQGARGGAETPLQGMAQLAQIGIGGLGMMAADRRDADRRQRLAQALRGGDIDAMYNEDPGLAFRFQQQQEAARREQEAAAAAIAREDALRAQDREWSVADREDKQRFDLENRERWDDVTAPDGRPAQRSATTGQLRYAPQPPQTTINNTIPGDEPTRKAFGTKQGENLAAVAQLGLDAGRRRSDLYTLGQALDRTPGGWQNGLLSLASRYGINAGEGQDKVELARSIINQLVPGQRQPGSGQMSDRDVQLFLDSLPGLVNTPDGNKLIVDKLIAIADYDEKRGQIAAQLNDPNVSVADVTRQLYEVPNPLADLQGQVRGDAPGAAPAQLRFSDAISPDEQAQAQQAIARGADPALVQKRLDDIAATRGAR